MTTLSVRTKRWGNSLGIILPSETVNAKGIKENQNLKIIILEDSRKVFRETFGMGKGKIKKTAQQIKDELRKELYDD